MHRLRSVYVLPHQVEEIDARLKELQQEDEDDFSERAPLDRPVLQRNNWSRRDRYGRQHFQQQQQQQQQNQPRLTIQRPTRSVKKEKSYREESDNEKDGDVKIGPKVKAFVKKRQKYVKKVEQVCRRSSFLSVSCSLIQLPSDLEPGWKRDRTNWNRNRFTNSSS